MTTEALIHGLRIYSVIVSSLVAVLGTVQAKRWRAFLPENQLVWIAVALLNLAVFVGSLQTLLEHAPGGERTYITALATTFTFYAVAYNPSKVLRRHLKVRRIVRRAAGRSRNQPEESP